MSRTSGVGKRMLFGGFATTLLASTALVAVGLSVAATSQAAPPVCVPVAITVDPTDVDVNAGGDATFSVTATGSGTITYQWYRLDGSWQEVTGATTNTLTLTGVTAADDGAQFKVTASNKCQSVDYSDTSTVATLTVVVPTPSETETQTHEPRTPMAVIVPTWVYVSAIPGGVTVEASGSGWLPNADVEVYIRPVGGGDWVLLGTCEAGHGPDEKGEFSGCTFDLPTNLGVGLYTIRFIDKAGNSENVKDYVDVTFEVKPVPTSTITPPPSGSTTVIVVPGGRPGMNVGVPSYTGDTAGFPLGALGLGGLVTTAVASLLFARRRTH